MPVIAVPTHYRFDLVLGGTRFAIWVRRGERGDEQFDSLVHPVNTMPRRFPNASFS